MLNTIRRRLDREEGVSLVETLVAMLILGVVLAGLMSTMVTAFAAVNSQEGRLRAQQLGSEAIEELYNLPWENVGISWDVTQQGSYPPTDPDQVADYEGQATVRVPYDARNPRALRTVSRGGVDYTVRTHIVWQDDPSGAVDVHKRLVVIITWTVRGTDREVRTEGLRTRTAPHANPDAFTVDLTVQELSATPDQITLNSANENTTTIQATAVTSHAASLAPDPVRLHYEPVAGSPVVVTMTGGPTVWTANIGPGTTWDTGPQVFTVQAHRASDPSQVALDVDMLQAIPPGGFTVTLEVDPEPIWIDSVDGRNLVNIAVTATTSMPGVGIKLGYETAGATAPADWETDPPSAWADMGDGPLEWHTTIAILEEQWEEGNRWFRAVARNSDDVLAIAEVFVDVEEAPQLGVVLTATPATVGLDDDGRIEQAILLQAVTTTDAVDGVVVTFSPESGPGSLDLVQTAPLEWEALIPAGDASRTWTQGLKTFTATASTAFGSADGPATVLMLEPVEILTVELDQDPICVTLLGQLVDPLTVDITVRGITLDHSVDILLPIPASAAPVEMDPDGNAVFRHTYGSGVFVPPTSAFEVRASRANPSGSDLDSSTHAVSSSC